MKLSDILGRDVSTRLVAGALSLTALYSSYTARPDYVQQPHWLRVEQEALPLGLYGFATPHDPRAVVRRDLEGMQHSEVRFHETIHNLYPACTEDEVRLFTLARFGSDAVIHRYVCPSRWFAQKLFTERI